MIRKDNTYGLPARALFGLIAAGDYDVLAGELAKGANAAGGYCDEFASALLRMQDTRGAQTVQAWTTHQDPVVSAACTKALRKASQGTEEDASGSDADGRARGELSHMERLIATKTVCVLLVRGTSSSGERLFCYLAVRADRLQAFMRAQNESTFYPEEFGIVLEAGSGEPSDEIRAKMTREYGFNHEAMLDISHMSGSES